MNNTGPAVLSDDIIEDLPERDDVCDEEIDDNVSSLSKELLQAKINH